MAQATIARANHLPSSNIVLLGATPGDPRRPHSSQQQSSSGSNTFAGRTYSSSVVGAAAAQPRLLSRRNLPSQSAMRDIIAAKARANGVDPALALAVSYQESGWNMHVVSVANAVGAMQVIPATSAWISGVVGRRLDPLDPQDNATTGVVLLKILTHVGEQRAAGGGGLLPGPAARCASERDVPRHAAVRRQRDGAQGALPLSARRRVRGRARGLAPVDSPRGHDCQRPPGGAGARRALPRRRHVWRGAAWPPSTRPTTTGSTAPSPSR